MKNNASLQLSSERLDIAAYRHAYDVGFDSIGTSDEFWNDEDTRSVILRLQFDKHE